MKRYQQQVLLPEIGMNGQEKINDIAVLVVGAGGLGTVVSSYLAAMGIGKLGIVDFDTVDETNLHRQIFYNFDDIGKNKAQTLALKLCAQNPLITVEAHSDKFTENNADKLLSEYRIICDCTDDINTRVELDKQCGIKSIPLVHGAVSGWEGYVTVFHYQKKYTYSDLFSSESLLQATTCNVNGISSPVCGIIGSYIANEVVKIAVGLENVLEGKLLYTDILKNALKILNFKKK